MYFEIERKPGYVTLETSWLPDLQPVRETLAPLGFVRSASGAWRVRVEIADFLGVTRRVTRALELLLTEAHQMIRSDEDAL